MSKYTESTFQYFPLRALCDRLKEISKISEETQSEVVENIRMISEALVWAEQNKFNFFMCFSLSLFQNNKMLKLFTGFLNQAFDKKILIQLIQTANLLVHNLRSQEHKQFLIDSKFYQKILLHHFEFDDEEITENYVSLLKGLAINLEFQQLKRYLIKNDYFLFTATVMFMDHKEWLIKTAAKTAILRILSLNDAEVDSFVITSGYFNNLVNHFKVSVASITANLFSGAKKLENILNDFQENIYYFNDIFSLNNSSLNANLSETLLNTFIFPVLVQGIIESHGLKIISKAVSQEFPEGNKEVNLKINHEVNHEIDQKFNEEVAQKEIPEEDPGCSEVISCPLTVCLYTLSQLLKLLSYPPLVSEIQSVLFSDKLKKDQLIQIMKTSSVHNLTSSSPLKDEVKNPISSSFYHHLSTSNDNVLGLCLYILHVSFNSSLKDFLECTDLEPSKFYENLADALSHVLIVTEQIRFYSFYFASKVLFELSAAKDKESEYHREHDVIKFALQKKIKSLQDIIKNTRKKLEFIKFFECEWEFTKSLKWVEIIHLPVNYLLESNDYNQEVPLQLRRSLSEDDAVITEIRLFLLFRKLKHLMIRCEIPESQDSLENPINSFFRCSLDAGKEYFLGTPFFKGKDLIEVKAKSVKFIVEDKFFFILGEKTNSGKMIRVEFVCRFSKIRLVESGDDTELMLLAESKPISFRIDDYFRYTDLRSSFQSKIDDCIKKDLDLLKSFISDTR